MSTMSDAAPAVTDGEPVVCDERAEERRDKKDKHKDTKKDKHKKKKLDKHRKSDSKKKRKHDSKKQKKRKRESSSSSSGGDSDDGHSADGPPGGPPPRPPVQTDFADLYPMPKRRAFGGGSGSIAGLSAGLAPTSSELQRRTERADRFQATAADIALAEHRKAQLAAAQPLRCVCS